MNNKIINGYLVMIIAPFILSGCAEKYRLDVEMEKLCRIDGGIKVYEKIVLPSSEFSPVGFPLTKYWNSASRDEDKLGPDYLYIEKIEVIRSSSGIFSQMGYLRKFKASIYRRSDGKIIGEEVSYGRTGGDIFLLRFITDQQTNKNCPLLDKDLLQSVFIRGA